MPDEEKGSKVIVDLEKVKQVLAAGLSPVQVYDAFKKLAAEAALEGEQLQEFLGNAKGAISIAWPSVRALSVANGQRKPHKGIK